MSDAHVLHPNVVPRAGRPDCCASGVAPTPAQLAPVTVPVSPHLHHGGAHDRSSRASLTTSATLHCLSGCALGEFAGLAIGVSVGLDPWTTMALATALGFLSGYTLGLWPLVRQGMGWLAAFKQLWLGETISIATMEFAMNFTDYHVGGVTASSVLAWQFWVGYLLALPAGFVVAWPVNWWLLSRHIKKPCH